MCLQPVLTDAVGVGVTRLDGDDVRYAEFGGFLDDEIGSYSFDWCEEEPEVGWELQWARLLGADEDSATLA